MLTSPADLMLYSIPYTISVALGTQVLGQTTDYSTLLDLVAVSAFIGGAFVISRTLGALKASEAARSALRDERDAAIMHRDRVVIELAEQKAKIVLLEARPSLGNMEALLQELISGQKQVLAAIANQHGGRPK